MCPCSSPPAAVVAEVAGWIRAAAQVTALTGAGISTIRPAWCADARLTEPIGAVLPALVGAALGGAGPTPEC
jgi:hypothetical protein